jgi:hypothetical protein
MAIDDPVSALQEQFENEERASDPVLRHVAKLFSRLPLPGPADKALGTILGHLQADRIEKMELLISVILEELRKLKNWQETINRGSEQEAQRHFQQWSTLVVDGLKKAERTRAKERVQRIGIILAKSLATVPPPGADEVEEMMRIAMELSDWEVRSLNDLVSLQGATVDQAGRISRYDAWNSWPTGPWGSRPDGETDSTFSKLESFGLVTRVPPQSNVNITADIQNCYALLKKGLRFVRFVKHQDQ